MTKKKELHELSTVRHGMASKGKPRYAMYRRWGSIISRCYNVNNARYADYGGRGINVCVKWRNNAEQFADDMGNPPYPEATIERINTNGPYSPENCIWATPKQQARNRRNNRYVMLNGTERLLVEVCEEYDVNYGLVKIRLDRGWTLFDALTLPKRR